MLIVDDDIRNVYGLTNALENLHMTVYTAQNGYECLELLEKHPEIDFVLLDIVMPEMDGVEALKRIRSNPDWADLAIIIMTARAMDRDQYLGYGANGYIMKPVRMEKVVAAIKELTGDQGA